jgi:hypothetical protein
LWTFPSDEAAETLLVKETLAGDYLSDIAEGVTSAPEVKRPQRVATGALEWFS